MRIVAFADTHGYHDKISLPDGDVLIFAGDMGGRSSLEDVRLFGEFLAQQPHKHKIVIAGNHDWSFMRNHEQAIELLGDVIYLQDSAVTIEDSIFYGSPWQPEFCNWAFNLPRYGDQLRAKWDAIPTETDVLITHGPPLGQRDCGIGCEYLAQIVFERVKPQLHVFGHSHEAYGVVDGWGMKPFFANVSICDPINNPVNKPIIFDYIRGVNVMVVEEKSSAGMA